MLETFYTGAQYYNLPAPAYIYVRFSFPLTFMTVYGLPFFLRGGGTTSTSVPISSLFFYGNGPLWMAYTWRGCYNSHSPPPPLPPPPSRTWGIFDPPTSAGNRGLVVGVFTVDRQVGGSNLPRAEHPQWPMTG